MKKFVSKACNPPKVSSLNPKSCGLLRRRLFFTTKILKACRNEKHSFSVETHSWFLCQYVFTVGEQQEEMSSYGGPESGSLILRAVQDNSHDVLM